MRRILLSASFPSDARLDAVGASHHQDIGLAAAATVEAVLRGGFHLVFGGHPTISPVVLNLAALIRDDAGVTIYQSDHFSDQVTHEVRRLQELEGVLVIPTADTGDREQSLGLMRQMMLSEPLSGAFFVGGMAGIEKEFEALKVVQDCPRFLFTAPGGRAARLAERLLKEQPDQDLPVQPLGGGTVALNGRGYARLALKALELIDRPDDPESPHRGGGLASPN